MPLVHTKWTRLDMLWIPAFVLACWVVWIVPAHAQVSGSTAKLFQAVNVNDMTAVKAALGAGADLAAKNPAGKTAADVAVDKGHFIIAHFLLSERNAKSASTQQKGSRASDLGDRLRKPEPKTARKLIGRQQKTIDESNKAPLKLSPVQPD